MKKYFIFIILIITVSEGLSQINKGQDLVGSYPDQLFGASIDLADSGDRIIIGARDSAGTVRTYDFINTEWVQIGQEFQSEQISDRVFSVSISGDGQTIAIGTPRAGINNKGNIQVYGWSNEVWIPKGNIINCPVDSDFFGQAISLNYDGNVLVAGTEGNSEMGTTSGEVTVYKFENNNWEKMGQDINGFKDSEFYGWKVDISSDGQRIASHSRNLGYIKIHEFNGQEWDLIGGIINSSTQPAPGNNFSFSGNGNMIAYESYIPGVDSTYVTMLKLENNEWKSYKTISKEVTSLGFFSEVAMSKNGEIITVLFEAQNGEHHIYLYKFSDGQYSQFGEMIPVLGILGRKQRLSEDGSTLMIGGCCFSSQNPDSPGMVKLFELDITTRTEHLENQNSTFKVFPNPSNNELNIQAPGKKISKLFLFDASGKEIRYFDDMASPIDISFLDKGIYFLKFVVDHDVHSCRIIKN